MSNESNNEIQNLYLKIYKYFQREYKKLDIKKFHFASRLFLWNKDEFYENELNQFKSYFINADNLMDSYTLRTEALKKFNSQRCHHLKMYPNLLKLHDILIRALYSRTIFNENLQKQLQKCFSFDQGQLLAKKLLSDAQSLTWLSSYSISYLYLFSKFFPTDLSLDLDFFYQIGSSQLDDQDTFQLGTKIYFFTHCIIGESLFYAREIPNQNLHHYQKYLLYIENLIRDYYQKISIDHKLEFLVCCRICYYQSKLTNKIYQEILASISEKGDYLIDKLNIYSKINTDSLMSAEHQNVLFLMSMQEYQPQSKI